MLAYQLAQLDEADWTIRLVRQMIDTGYWCSQVLREHAAFASLRGNPEFDALIETAERKRQRARRVFLELGGDRILKLPVAR